MTANASSRRRPGSAVRWVFLIVWFFLMIVGRSGMFRDPGTFWHTVVGERILSTGTLIETDPFSFTRGGRPWIAQFWLAQCAMALLYRLGGFESQLVVVVTMLTVTYSWLFRRISFRASSWLPATVVLLLVLVTSAHHFHVRPHIATIALLALSFCMMVDYEAGRMSLASLLWLPPLFVVWANLHAGALGGIATFVLCVGGWIIWFLIGKESPVRGWRDAVLLLALALGSVAAVLVNPYGLELPRTWYRILHADLPTMIREHAPLTLDTVGISVLFFGIGSVAVLWSVGWRWPRVTWLIPLVWLVLSFERIRHSPLFAVVAAVALAEVLPKSRWAKSWAAEEPAAASTGDREKARRGFWRLCLIPVTVVVLSLAFQAAGVRLPIVGAGWVRLDPTYWPVGMVPELHKQAKGRNPRVFNNLLFGGFVIFFAPEYQVFIDDRCELYDGLLVEYVEGERSAPQRLNRWAEQYGFDLALTRRGSKFDRYLQSQDNWILVRRDRAASLYRRRD